MRTTLSLDDDVTAMLERERKRTDQPLKQIVNAALREGLRHLSEPSRPATPFKTRTFDAGACYFPNLDNVQEVLEEAEGAWHK